MSASAGPMAGPRSVLVTGAARGIGPRIAAAFAACGDRVWVTDIDGAGAREAAAAIGDGGLAPRAATMDVRDADAVAAVVGAIVNIASVSSVRGGGAVGNVWYGTTKAAVVAMTAGLARELGPHGVRVNAISPGVVETDMVRAYLRPEVRERVLGRFPLGRLATVDDVAAMAVFLASPQAAFVTGQTIAVDGGFLTN